MLLNIKSEYFIQIIISHLIEGIKLKIFRYNKILQNKIDINLINYKLFSGRYIINEENGKIKEYDILNDKLIFEGEYKNGKRNGKGREYDDIFNVIKYEGEYLNGKRNGKGKEYNYAVGVLLFEGEFLNGVKWNGKGYNKYNEIIYEIKDGKGTVRECENFYSTIAFEGEYIDGERNGKGKEYDCPSCNLKLI